MKLKVIRNLILIIMLIFSPLPSWADISDPALRYLSNQVMRDIFDKIMDSKAKFPELSDFSENNLYKNPEGVYAIKYEKLGDEKDVKTFAIGVTIVGMDAQSGFERSSGAFNLGFPLLNIRFSGFQQARQDVKSFNLMPMLQQFGQKLLDEQQNYIPIKLKLEAAKDIYKVGESVDFTVTITNNTGRAVKIKDFNNKTLFFLYNDKAWGATQVNRNVTQGVKNIVLDKGKSYSKQFKGSPFGKAQEIEIYCSYVMTFKGVKPAASLKLKIEK